MSEHTFRTAEDYRDHLPCRECGCACHGYDVCPAPPLAKDFAVSGMSVEETKAKIRKAKTVDEAFDAVRIELTAAMAKFPPFNSAHEGHSVIEEEFDELWDEIKLKQGERTLEFMRAEAVQVAAMAIRFIVDVCNAEKVQK